MAKAELYIRNTGWTPMPSNVSSAFADSDEEVLALRYPSWSPGSLKWGHVLYVQNLGGVRYLPRIFETRWDPARPGALLPFFSAEIDLKNQYGSKPMHRVVQAVLRAIGDRPVVLTDFEVMPRVPPLRCMGYEKDACELGATHWSIYQIDGYTKASGPTCPTHRDAWAADFRECPFYPPAEPIAFQ